MENLILPASKTGAHPVDRLASIIRRLRAPDGCPWDREQTHDSLKGGLLEEAYEVVEAINRKDTVNLREELGDLLLQTIFHSQIAEDAGHFPFEMVVEEVCEKLIRRHPHVFGDASAETPDAVLRQWDAIKRQEKGAASSALGEIPAALPALMQAEKVQKRAARVGFDWTTTPPVLAKVREEIDEIEQALATGASKAELAEEVGDLLFAAVNIARHLRVEAEGALIEATRKFTRRFHAMEGVLAATGRSVDACSASELDEIWESIKDRESAPAE